MMNTTSIVHHFPVLNKEWMSEYEHHNFVRSLEIGLALILDTLAPIRPVVLLDTINSSNLLSRPNVSAKCQFYVCDPLREP